VVCRRDGFPEFLLVLLLVLLLVYSKAEQGNQLAFVFSDCLSIVIRKLVGGEYPKFLAPDFQTES
jgi:hypothetical protein